MNFQTIDCQLFTQIKIVCFIEIKCFIFSTYQKKVSFMQETTLKKLFFTRF